MWKEETTDNKFIGCFFEHGLHGLHGFFGKGHGEVFDRWNMVGLEHELHGFNG